jgi:hypothetical protein
MRVESSIRFGIWSVVEFVVALEEPVVEEIVVEAGFGFFGLGFMDLKSMRGNEAACCDISWISFVLSVESSVWIARTSALSADYQKLPRLIPIARLPSFVVPFSVS